MDTYLGRSINQSQQIQSVHRPFYFQISTSTSVLKENPPLVQNQLDKKSNNFDEKEEKGRKGKEVRDSYVVCSLLFESKKGKNFYGTFDAPIDRYIRCIAFR